MLTLGIESSCDETAAAVLLDGTRILSNVIHSQIPVHARYGGVVPELASRGHVMAVLPVIGQALDDAGVGVEDIDLIGVTVGPGLVGSLLVGLETAKMLAYVHDCQLVGVNHIEGHVLSPLIDPECSNRLEFPYIALVVSGGHTSLIWVRGVGDYKVLGRTLDDAAGEALDKVAKRLGGPYPGGPYIQDLAVSGDPARYALPRPMIRGTPRSKQLLFSFSGLKTAASLRIADLEKADPEGAWRPDLCASVQQAVVDTLLYKAFKAVERTGVRHLVIAGGVACNRELRAQAERRGRQCQVEVVVPSPRLCTDNGAMIACVAAQRATAAATPQPGRFSQATLDVDANLQLAQGLLRPENAGIFTP